MSLRPFLKVFHCLYSSVILLQFVSVSILCLSCLRSRMFPGFVDLYFHQSWKNYYDFKYCLSSILFWNWLTCMLKLLVLSFISCSLSFILLTFFFSLFGPSGSGSYQLFLDIYSSSLILSSTLIILFNLINWSFYFNHYMFSFRS